HHFHAAGWADRLRDMADERCVESDRKFAAFVIADVFEFGVVAPRGGVVRDAELLECERVAPTGTRLGKVTCLTAEEREALASEGRDQLERMQRSARGATKDPPR
ncbi:MAG: hypothetical protein AAFZ58_11010, partial [Pseudomonadota bacterium]